MEKVYFKGLKCRTISENSELRSSFKKDFVNDTEKVFHENSMLDEIFAPDPITGNPNSDLFFKLNHEPEVRQFIEKELQSFVFEVQKTDDKDLALDVVKSRYETVQQYSDRLRSYFAKREESK